MSSRDQYANLSNITFIENLYSQYLEDPNSVDESWRYFFEGMSLGTSLQGKDELQGGESPDLRVFHLIEAYRLYGHKAAQFNPIERDPIRPESIKELQLEAHQFKETELNQNFPTCGFLKEETAPLREIIEALQKTYCKSVGFEYMGMQHSEMEAFIQEKIEPMFHFNLSKDEKMSILTALNKAEIMESFIHMKYPGQKRFSLEGGETMIPVMVELIQEAAKLGVEQVVLGMAHRGRLNVLANVLGKSYAEIFKEFESGYIPSSFEGSGDVKYHKGYSDDLETKHGKSVHVSLCANPSHLEAVNPVVEGKTRAKQEMGAQGRMDRTVPILIHGDAAIAGQGVVYETMQLSKLEGYRTGGTIHIVINNQVGFTASPQETKSTRYCTDIAKSFGAPVFHLNAECPESCYVVAQLAMQLRQKFQCDVMLELNCYRKYGHNETDEPAFTHPQTYEIVKRKENIRNLYRDFLAKEGTLTQELAEKLESDFKSSLESALQTTDLERSQPELPEKRDMLEGVATAVSLESLQLLAEKFCKVPDEFHLNSKVKRLLNDRVKMLQDREAPYLDWGMAEHLAYASLLNEGVAVRLSGQDCGRGTFSHRHAILTDQTTSARYIPLAHISEKQAPFTVYNSPLSEYAVMGFEYGYSLVRKKGLTIWEAQFGDFANGAQVVIDQFLVAAEQKWGKASSLTLLLPHGYEGQGPEHSSGRIERFLQLAGDDNFYLVVPSTPSQFFHVLRRQGVSNLRKPLFLFTPKALLRYPPSLSKPESIVSGQFEEVMDDPKELKEVSRIIFCSGKVYYDLLENRKRDDIAIIRIEQLYPFYEEKVLALMEKYKGADDYLWVQEEPQNQGAWSHISPLIENILPEKKLLRYVGRRRSASTAAGSLALHKAELSKLLKEALE